MRLTGAGGGEREGVGMGRKGRRAAAATGPGLHLLAGLAAGGGTTRQAERDVRLLLDGLAGGRFGGPWQRQRLDAGALEAGALLARLRRCGAERQRHHDDRVVVYLAGPGDLRRGSEPLLHTATGTVGGTELLAAAAGPGRLLLVLDLWTGAPPDPGRVRAAAQRVAPPAAPAPSRRVPSPPAAHCELVLAARERAGPGPSFAQVFLDALESPRVVAASVPDVPLPAAVEEADRELRRDGCGVAVHRLLSGTGPLWLPNPNHRPGPPYRGWLIPGSRAEQELRAWLADGRTARPLAVLNSPAAARPSLLRELLHGIAGLRGEELNAGRTSVTGLLAGVALAVGSDATTLGGLLDDLRSRPSGAAPVVLIDGLPDAPDPELLLRDLVDPLIRYGGGRIRLVLGTDREQARRLTGSREAGHQPVLLDLFPAEAKRLAARSPLPPYPAPPDAGAAELLLPVAYALGHGLPWEGVWPALVDALRDEAGGKPDWERLTGELRAELVTDLVGGRSVYRLARPGLAEQLRAGRDRRQDQARIAEVLVAQLPRRPDGRPDWTGAHPYTRRHLATHAAAGGRLDPLLADAGFLLHATRPELLDALAAARSRPGRAARAAYLSPAVPTGGDPVPRAAALALAAAGTGAAELAASAAGWAGAAPQPRWVRWAPPRPRLRLSAPGPVRSLAFGEADQRLQLLAGVDPDEPRTASPVLSWDLRTGARLADPAGDEPDQVAQLVTTARVDGRPTGLARLGDGRLLSWDLATGRPGPVRRHGRGGAAPARLGTRTVLAVCGLAAPDGRLEAWDAAADGLVQGHPGREQAEPPVVATLRAGPRTLVAAAGPRGRGIVVRDLRTGRTVTELDAGGDVTALVLGRVEDGPVLIAGTGAGTVEAWLVGSPANGWERLGRPLPVHPAGVTALACGSHRDRPLVLVAAGEAVTAWDLLERQQVAAPVGTGHPVRALALAGLDDRPLVAAGAEDGTVAVWDLFGDGEQPPTPGVRPGPVHQVAVVAPPGPDAEPLLITRQELGSPGCAAPALHRLADGESVPAEPDGRRRDRSGRDRPAAVGRGGSWPARCAAAAGRRDPHGGPARRHRPAAPAGPGDGGPGPGGRRGRRPGRAPAAAGRRGAAGRVHGPGRRLAPPDTGRRPGRAGATGRRAARLPAVGRLRAARHRPAVGPGHPGPGGRPEGRPGRADHRGRARAARRRPAAGGRHRARHAGRLAAEPAALGVPPGPGPDRPRAAGPGAGAGRPGRGAGRLRRPAAGLAARRRSPGPAGRPGRDGAHRGRAPGRRDRRRRRRRGGAAALRAGCGCGQLSAAGRRPARRRPPSGGCCRSGARTRSGSASAAAGRPPGGPAPGPARSGRPAR